MKQKVDRLTLAAPRVRNPLQKERRASLLLRGGHHYFWHSSHLYVSLNIFLFNVAAKALLLFSFYHSTSSHRCLSDQSRLGLSLRIHRDDKTYRTLWLVESHADMIENTWLLFLLTTCQLFLEHSTSVSTNSPHGGKDTRRRPGLAQEVSCRVSSPWATW